MNRRSLLIAGAALAAGGTGCIDTGPREPETNGSDGGVSVEAVAGETGNQEAVDHDEAEWRYPLGARIHEVVEDVVVGVEDSTSEESRGGVLALDSASGDRLWRYGETGGYSTWTRPVYDETLGTLYLGWGDDAVGSGSGDLHALGLESGEGWKADVGSVYDPPVVEDGVVYVGSDSGAVYALDAEDGEEVWRFEFEREPPDSTSVDAVESGVVYVRGETGIRALDSSDGGLLWSYGADEDVRPHGLAVDDGVVYFTEYGRTAAVEDGDELWSRELDGNDRLRGLSHGNLYVGDVYALDPSDGETRWRVDGGGEPAFADDAVYLGGERLRRVTPEGDVDWTEGFDDVDEVERLRAVDGGVYAVAGYEDEDGLHRVSDAGDVERSVDVDGTVTGYVVDDAVYVGTIEDVKAYEI